MQMQHVLMHLCIRPVRHVRSDCTQKSLAMLQSRCKIFISRGVVPCSVRKDETVSEGNWRSPLSATNATGDAIPRDASFQLCFSSTLSQPSLLIVSLLSFCPAVMHTPLFSLWFWLFLASSLQACMLPQERADSYLQACVHSRCLRALQPLFWGHPSSFRWRIKWLWNANAAN